MATQIDGDDEQRRRLRHMQRLALALLLVMSAIYAWCETVGAAWAWTGYLRAFSEAAMVGALADWFAVTALFRRPLGLPIPHTAIIPQRKDEIGENLARFVQENFLTAEALAPRLEGMDFTAHVAAWLAMPANRTRLTEDAAAFTSWMTRLVDNSELRNFMHDQLHLSLREIELTPFIGRVLDLLTSGEHYQQLLDALVRAGRRTLEENKARLRDRVGENSPWWLPRFVDQEIYDKLITEIESLLDAVGADDEHEARRRFSHALHEFINRLKSDPTYIARGEALKHELLEHPRLRAYLAELWGELSGVLLREARDPESRLRRQVDAGMVRFGTALTADSAMGAEINRWLRDATLRLVTRYREELAGIITETVKTWDPVSTAERIELQVGRDLQFIRINGTLVGGLAGLIIYALSRLL